MEPTDLMDCAICRRRPEPTDERMSLHVELSHVDDNLWLWLCSACTDAVVREMATPSEVRCAICEQTEAVGDALHVNISMRKDHIDDAWVCQSCQDAVLAALA